MKQFFGFFLNYNYCCLLPWREKKVVTPLAVDPSALETLGTLIIVIK